MALEDLLTKLITSLDANTAAHKASAAASGGKPASASAAATTKPAKGADKTPSFDEVKAAAAKVMDAKGKPFTKAMIKDVGGAPELATVKPEKYGALIAAFTKALEEGGGAVDEDEDEL